MSYNDPKVGEVISSWEMTEPYKCTESGPAENQNGDNPSYSPDVSLPSEGDTRNREGGSNSPPAPGKTGAGI